MWDARKKTKIFKFEDRNYGRVECATTTQRLQLTPRRPDGEGDRVAGLLDEVDNVAVVESFDVYPVDGKDAVANVESPAPLGWTAFNDAACGGGRLITSHSTIKIHQFRTYMTEMNKLKILKMFIFVH